MSPLVAIQYLRRRAAISAGTNSGAQTRDATVLLLIADLIRQLAAENAILDRRPAMNDGLREAYAEWSGEVYAMGARAAVGEEERDEKNARKATGLTDD